MRIFWSALGLVFLGACSASTSMPPVAPASPAARKAPLLVAHRGGAALAPENTLAAFRNGLALGADYLELDVHLSQDGVPVVMHDPAIERTTDGTGRISDYTVAQLQQFNAAAKFTGPAERQGVPTFAQVCDLVKDTTASLEVEIKVMADGRRYAGIEKKVIDELAARHLVERTKVISFDFGVVKDVKALEPRLKAIALFTFDYFRKPGDHTPAAVIDDVVALHADGIGVNKDLLTQELTDEAHRRNLLVGVWTVDSEAEMQKFIRMGVDSITTNRPDVLKRVLGR